ncbi:MAG: glycosyltransferase family 4 protein [Acidimicrobiales bacterium]|nr:glycosyltransferase family 4 protein [Acidimicrobiales bacterium]
MNAAKRRPHVLVLVQNAPIERDTRVQRLVTTLSGESIPSVVICPATAASTAMQISGVRILRFPPARERSGMLGFALEYAWSLLAMTALVIRVLWRTDIGLVHLCNPPDLLFLAALPCRLRGARLVFDHHDPAPEMYEARFGRRDSLHRVLLLAERASFRIADHVVSTNETLARLACERGGSAPSEVTVVRNAPALSPDEAALVRAADPDRAGPRVLWIGHMGPDDGVDIAIDAHRLLVARRPGVRLVLVGDGEARPDLETRVRRHQLTESVEWTGWLDPAQVHRELAAADVAIVPDPRTPRSDLSSMIKLTEYMTFGVPIVAFPLRESVAGAGDAALFVDDETPAGLAAGIERVLEDDDLARRLGENGRRRMAGDLAWSRQAERYIGVVRRLLDAPPPRP